MSHDLDIRGREILHYTTLDELYAFSNGEPTDIAALSSNLKQTIDDWDALTGKSSQLTDYTDSYTKAVREGNQDESLVFYFLLSPIFFYIHSLQEVSRKIWRGAVTSSGIYCERIVRNLLQTVDQAHRTSNWNDLKDSTFDNRNGRLKAELERLGFDPADRLFSLLKIIYASRNQQGPHDVPPPESMQAKIVISQCLPVYIDYLNCLQFFGVDLQEGFNNYVEFFSGLTQTSVNLFFEEHIEGLTCSDAITGLLYKRGFFSEGRSMSDVNEALQKNNCNYSKPSISINLAQFSKGRTAFLTRRGKRGSYKFIQRVPPEIYYKTTL